MKTILMTGFISLSWFLHAQNVGIGTVNPTELLDVNGNINVTGTIKANGTDGNPNQVLMKNSTGSFVWGDMCDYKNVAYFSVVGTSTWMVPAGVTKIAAEVYGGGGGGNIWGGGGGGGYIRGNFVVTPGGSISYTVGNFSSGVSSGTASAGGNSSVSVGTATIIAGGGGGASVSSATTGQVGTGGSTSATNTVNFIAINGRPGEPSEKQFMQYNATTYYEIGRAGKGGDAGNTTDTGNPGLYYIFNTTANTLVFRSNSTSLNPRAGGGGSGGIEYPLVSTGGGNSGAGLVIIHY